MEKTLRKRSEIIKDKAAKAAGETKPSAAERTVAVPGTADGFQCKECGGVSVIAKSSKRANGDLECEHCGMPHDASDLKASGVVGAQSGTGKEVSKTEGPPKTPQPDAFCNQCGAKWVRLEVNNWKPFPNCGHDDGFVDDPTKAKAWKPPPGHPRPEAMTEHRKLITSIIVPDDRNKSIEPRMQTTTLQDGRMRLDVEWGKLTIQRGHYSTVGPFALHTECAPEKVLEVGIHMLGQLEQLADHAMKQQRAWWKRKLKEIQTEEEEGG